MVWPLPRTWYVRFFSFSFISSLIHQGPLLEKICKEKGVEMCAYDIDESSEFAEQYGVKSIPQVFVFCMLLFYFYLSYLMRMTNYTIEYSIHFHLRLCFFFLRSITRIGILMLSRSILSFPPQVY